MRNSKLKGEPGAVPQVDSTVVPAKQLDRWTGEGGALPEPSPAPTSTPAVQEDAEDS